MSAVGSPLTREHLQEVDGNMIRLLPHGPDRLAHVLETIATASRKLALQYYTFNADQAGTRIRDALIEACARGVAVSLLVDSFGSNETPDEFFNSLREAGAKVRWFGTRWTPRYLIRNHQKLLIADNATVICGGFNIGDDYFAPASAPPAWQDMGMVITGPFVDVACRWFDLLEGWMDSPRPRFRDLRRMINRFNGGKGTVRLLVGGPTARLSPWARGLRSAMIRATSVHLSMAYFSPNAGFMRRLGRILKRGGKVNLVLPAHSDNSATIGASRLLYNYLLRRGASIAEFEPSRLHNKICVIDNVTMIGSSNFDMRSLYVNMELMVLIDDRTMADLVRSLIAAQADQSTIITPQLHKSRATWLNRLRWAAAWLVVSIVDYGVTRRLNFGLPPAE